MLNQLSFLVVALLPAVFAIVITLLEKKTKFGKIKYAYRQIIIGVLFGLLAIIGTEWGIPINGAQVNARDAAVLTAGLVFGGPAGIIAGVIGGIERALAITWGVGQYTWIACSISTCLAGFFGAALRRFMFDGKRPGFLISFAIGVVMEDFHMLMVLFTHLDQPGKAFNVISACTLPMVVGNSLAILVAVLAVTALTEKRLFEKKEKTKIYQTIQKWLLITVALAFLISSFFVFNIQTSFANNTEKDQLITAVDDTENDINDAYTNKLIRYMDVSDSNEAYYYNNKAYTEVDMKLIDITRNRHAGKSGFVLLSDRFYNLLSAPDDVTESTATTAVRLVKTHKQDEVFQAEIDGVVYECMYRTVKEYFVFALIPASEAYETRNNSTYINSFMEILIFAIMFGVIYMLIKKLIVNNLNRVNALLGKITQGDLDVEVNIKSNSEFVTLSNDINKTVGALKTLIQEAKERIDKELELAKDIQSSALPIPSKAFPKKVGFDIHATMDPAKEVGGDFYDFYMTGEETINFLIADVSGKGIPAAMFMMRSKAELKTLTEYGLGINEVFTQGNNALCEGNDSGMFVTAWQAQVDLTNGHVTFANAGHNPPLIKKKDGAFEYLRTRAGFVLAGMDGIKYKLQELDLDPGDIIFIYTDGVTEANNKDEELYGEDRLLEAINSVEYETMEDLCHNVKSEVDAFVGDADQFDDMTMVAFKFDGIAPSPSLTIEEAGLEDLSTFTEFIETELEKLNCPMKAVMQICVATDEIYSNIIRHGYKNKKGPVTIRVILSDDEKAVHIRYEDEAVPYNPLANSDADITLTAEEREIGGLGIFIVRKTMDEVRYKYEHNKNIFTITKEF